MPSVEPRVARSANAERPDPSYWTVYDHFMIEREARALRRAYTWSLITSALARLRARLAGTPGASPRSAPRLSPRT